MMTSILLVSLGLLLGSMLFFAAVVAPSVFTFVSSAEAGILLRGLFPRYYLWGIVLSLLITGLAAMVNLVALLASASVLLLFVIARQLLMPAINNAREQVQAENDIAKARFRRLHLVSVIINLLQMLILIALAISLV